MTINLSTAWPTITPIVPRADANQAAVAPVPVASPPAPSVIVTLSGIDQATTPATYAIPAVIPTTLPSRQTTDATLTIQTARGQTVTLTLHRDDKGLNITSKGDDSLTDAERTAIASLSDGIKASLDAFAAVPPRLDLGTLARYDSSVVSSVQLKAQKLDAGGETQTIDFQANDQIRSVKVDGPAGKFDVSVDLSTAATWGTQARRNDAIATYVAQIDQAALRGRADPTLTAMFKDAFVQMNTSYGIPASGTTSMRSPWVTDTDHALLSGLADFSASVTQTAKASNPYCADEHDAFSYQLSQATQVSGRGARDRDITQTTQSRLRASFHDALYLGDKLNLTELPESQNYYYTQIDDTAQSRMSIGYRKGQLVQADLTRSASQSTHRSKYFMAKLVEDTTTPLQRSQKRDLLGLLQPLESHPPQTPREQLERAQTLDAIHQTVGFEPDPIRINASRT